MAGGTWDRLERRFLDPVLEREPETVAVIDMVESQVPFTLWFAEFLRDFREGYPRDISLALAAGDRRGGKTFDTYYCQIAALVDVPFTPQGMPSIGWTVSRTFRERHELDELLVGRIPAEWYVKKEAPERVTLFRHGSILRNVSVDDPDATKMGRVDWLLYNEPQKMSPRAVKNGLYGTADQAGLTILAANPPSPADSEWLLDLKESIEEEELDREQGLAKGEPLGAVFFNFDSKLNPMVDAPARQRVARLAAIIDPEGAEADAEGTWKRWGDRAYPAFNARPVNKGGMVGAVPEIGRLADITRKVTGDILFQDFPKVGGADFQGKPHHAGAVARIFERPEDGKFIYWFTDEILAKGNEEALSVQAFAQGYTPEELGWIADCSGSFQGSERIPGRTSFNMLAGHGWQVWPANTIKIPERSAHPKNPDVAQRLVLMMTVMEEGRFRVDPRCPWLIKALLKCLLRKTDYGKRVPKGREAHITDGAGYLLWRLEPKPDDVKDWSLEGFGAVQLERKGSPFPSKRR